MEAYQTPGIDEVFDLYVAYGYVEALVRGGAGKVALVPEGTAQGGYYSVEGDGDFRRGLIDALEEMLSLHYALLEKTKKKESREVSWVDFSKGAIVEQGSQKKIPQYLSEILNLLKASKTNTLNKKKYTVPLPLMPSAGKYTPQYFKMPTKSWEANAFNYALAWVGFHYYTPYLRYTKGAKTWVHVYQVAPQESLNLVELLALKDLKKHFPHYYESGMDYLSNRRLALLYHLLHTESPGAIETVMGKSIILRSYTLEVDKTTNNQAIRSYGEENIGKLMDFLWELKRRSTYHAVRFLDSLLRKESDAVLAIVDAVLNDRPEGLYLGLRTARRAGITPPRSVVEGMEAFMDGPGPVALENPDLGVV